MLQNSASKLRVPLHRVGQRRAAFDVGARLQDDLREVLVLFLVAENVETLHERQAGVDHHRELAREDRQVLRRHALGLELARLRRRARLGLRRLDPRDLDLLAPQRGDDRVHRVADALAR